VDLNSFEIAGQNWEDLGTFTAGAGGSLRVVLSNADKVAIFGSGDVAGNAITVGNAKLETGDKVVFYAGTGSTGNLVAAKNYYVIRINSTQIRLAADPLDVILGTAVNLGAIAGSGHFLSKADVVVAGRARIVGVSNPAFRPGRHHQCQRWL